MAGLYNRLMNENTTPVLLAATSNFVDFATARDAAEAAGVLVKVDYLPAKKGVRGRSRALRRVWVTERIPVEYRRGYGW